MSAARIAACFVILLALLGCEQVSKLDAQLYDSTEADVPITKLDQLSDIDRMEAIADKENSGSILLKAWGSEPGWTAEFYNNRVKLALDYGKEEFVVYDNAFENAANEKGFSFSNHTNKSKKIDLDIKIESASCTDASGGSQPRKVTIACNGKTYTGCGRPIH